MRTTTKLSRSGFLRHSAAAGAGLALAGVGASRWTGSASAMSMQEVRVVTGWINDAEFAGYFVAQKRGWYAKEGINHIWSSGANLVPRQLVAAGRDDVGIDSTDTALVLRSQGAPIVVLGAPFQKNPAGIMSLASAPILTPKDLIGKKIGLQPGSLEYLLPVLDAHGISRNQIQIVNAGYDPSPLTSHQVDGFWSFITNEPVLLAAQGIKTAFLLVSDWGGFPYSDVLITNENFLTKHEDTLVAWMKATIKGWELVQADPVAAAQATMAYANPGLKLNEQIGQAKAEVPLMTSPLTKKKGLLWVDPAVFAKVQKSLISTKHITSPVDIGTFVNLSILEKAYGGKTQL